ncbi:MAG TPA: hypothetical protein VKR55_30325 [Bradyrhizobium sp.]|uniref:hypothetical protein n=1 Tax=Bradyrhizobium sp. TaxID=376 RepID=UPI002CEEC0BA|nr:hypothetical protein [Bradyrhizobium sp.]HLZ06430.1 hypothetical protein [Bradyrhizobium sp.]
MTTRRNRGVQAALLSLEADAASARGGFACVFSTSDEFESALIRERRAQGHYGRGIHSRPIWPIVLFVACAMLLAASALLFG